MMINKIRQNISSNLVKLRNLNRYSQDQIAAVLSIKQPSYCEMESSVTKIRAEQLYILANFYKISIESFFCDGNDFQSLHCSQDKTLKLESELANSKVINNILIARNLELEDKVKRKDAKIESLIDELTKSGIKQGLKTKEVVHFSSTLKASAMSRVLFVSIIIFSILISVFLLSQQLSQSSQHVLRKKMLEANSISDLNVLMSEKDFQNDSVTNMGLIYNR
ncbi:hypothetical protein SAMN05216436_1216 [bacterium A37T11]|nr:hypothetical protein SAMN05216436_1216 [bacterium A37T11]